MNTQTISATRKERAKKAWQAAITQKTVDIPSEWWGKTIQVIGYAYTPQQTWRGNTFQIVESANTIELSPKIMDVAANWVGETLSIRITTVLVPSGSVCFFKLKTEEAELPVQVQVAGDITTLPPQKIMTSGSIIKIEVDYVHPSVSPGKLPSLKTTTTKRATQP